MEWYCTNYGKNIIVELTTELSKRNITILIGMSKGIDGYVHIVSLHNNYEVVNKNKVNDELEEHYRLM